MAKLSPAQIKALNEVHELGYTNARKNTLDSVAKYCTADGEKLKLNADGLEMMGIETVTVDDVLAELNTNPLDVVPSFPAGWAMTPHNRKAWEGLTEEEIRADIATARPVANRKDIRSGNVLKSKHF